LAQDKMRRGNCYVTCEALYHLLGGKSAGYKPMTIRVDGQTHWVLKHIDGLIIDPTKQQFRCKVDYSKARGRGFLTRKPSKRAKKLMNKLLWQDEK
jgi:hypothetical protein